MSDQLEFLLNALPNLLIGFPNHRPGGLLLSIILAISGIGLGFLPAVLAAAGSESRYRPIRLLARLYVQLVRGLPLILLLLLVQNILGLSFRRLNISATTAAVVTLALFSSAYQAEVIRAGLRAVPVSIVESARTLGDSPLRVFWVIKLRYALRVMLPALAGEAISLFKDTSIVVVLGVADLMTVASVALGSSGVTAPYWVGIYTLVGLLYFIVAFALSQFLQQREKGSVLAGQVQTV